uniref:Replication factor A C-terminal domain-containing protein n=1 Tax=Arundo donax TaxID=35708 RepID=A0A0A9A4Y5_ARUDO
MCNKSCKPEGSGYKCYECNCSNYIYKYKLFFMASDGTAEVKMISFSEIARRIVGKNVEAVMRSARRTDGIPPDIAAIVSLKFTFNITLTDQSYHEENKVYQINSIVACHGRQHPMPRLPVTPDYGQPSTTRKYQTSTQTESASKALCSHKSPQTPSPSLQIAEDSSNYTPVLDDNEH